MRMVAPLNGTNTHPLSDAAREVLRRLASGPIPRQEINPGVANRLEREALVVARKMPSPYKTVPGDVTHLEITEAGREATSKVK